MGRFILLLDVIFAAVNRKFGTEPVTYGREKCKYLRFIGTNSLGDFLVMSQKFMQRMIHDDPWLPVKYVSRTNKDSLPFTDLFVGALSLIRSHINEFYIMRFPWWGLFIDSYHS